MSASEGEGQLAVYVSDDYFPPDDTDLQTAHGSTTADVAAPLTTSSGGGAGSRWLARLAQYVARREARHRSSGESIEATVTQSLNALEAYVYSDDAVQRLHTSGWSHVAAPNATWRRQGRWLMRCMQGHSPYVSNETLADAADAGFETENNVDENVSVTTSEGNSPPFSSSYVKPLARGFTNTTFPSECWKILEADPRLPSEGGVNVYVLLAAFTFVQTHIEEWARNWLLLNSKPGTSNLPHPDALSSPNSSLSDAHNTSSTSLSIVMAASSLGHGTLHVMRCCLHLVRCAYSGVVQLLFFSSSSATFLPSRDSVMGALASNVLWRLQVELLLLLVAALLVLLWGVIGMRYRKYTRTVEFWEAEAARRNAGEERRWMAEMEQVAWERQRNRRARRSAAPPAEATAAFVFPAQESVEARGSPPTPDGLARTRSGAAEVQEGNGNSSADAVAATAATSLLLSPSGSSGQRRASTDKSIRNTALRATAAAAGGVVDGTSELPTSRVLPQPRPLTVRNFVDASSEACPRICVVSPSAAHRSPLAEETASPDVPARPLSTNVHTVVTEVAGVDSPRTPLRSCLAEANDDVHSVHMAIPIVASTGAGDDSLAGPQEDSASAEGRSANASNNATHPFVEGTTAKKRGRGSSKRDKNEGKSFCVDAEK